jgi:hypothetical protein
MDLKYLLILLGLVLLIGNASAAGEPTNVGIMIPYNATLLDKPMWFNATAEGATSYRSLLRRKQPVRSWMWLLLAW